jgi:hypothetical protein
MSTNFSWVPFYKELAIKLTNYEDKQSELFAVLNDALNKGFKIGYLEDKDEKGNRFQLKEMCPFTFFGTFNRKISKDNRLGTLGIIKAKFGIKAPMPEDFDGIPIVENRKSWFFSYTSKRKTEDVPLLWKLFKEAVNKKITAGTFDKVQKINGVKYNITMGLFWLNPEEYINLDETNRPALKNMGITYDKLDYVKYKQILKEVKSKFAGKFYDFSYQSWLEIKGKNESTKNYWAAGIHWGKKNKCKDFINDSCWQIGWDTEDTDKGAVEARKNIKRVKVGDELALTSHGGKNNLVVHYIAKVNNISVKEGKIFFEKINNRTPYFRNIAPKMDKHNWFGITLRQVTGMDAINQAFSLLPITSNNEQQKDTIMNEQNIKNISLPKNVILYGPPGTGKTYYTVNKALEICSVNTESMEKRSEIKAEFQKLVDAGKIVFTTFHQSMTYEDFIEGIKPKLVNEDDDESQLAYELKDGILKRLAIEASFEYLKDSESVKNAEDFSSAYDALVDNIQEKLERNKSAEYSTKSNCKVFVYKVSAKGNLYLKHSYG